MKTKIIYILILQGMMLHFTSCKDWLDVSSSSQITSDDMFSDYEGFRTAINGVYRLLGSKNLYAKELNWGMVSVLGHNYDHLIMHPDYADFLTGDYTTLNSENIIKNVWQDAYNVIANCNNIIQEAEKKDSSFFLEGNIEKQLILGEARGVRAMLHLDMLRLFAPAPKVDDGRKYIPYVKNYPERQPEYRTVSETLEFIIEDLEFAKQTLVYHDTLYNIRSISTPTDRFVGYGSTIGGNFFWCRGARMNYFAASALLARTYLYNGDKENAYRHANDMYQFASRKNYYRFTSNSNLGNSNINRVHRKMYDDIILAAINQNLYDYYDDMYDWLTYGHFAYKNVDYLFGADLDDYRLTKLVDVDLTSLRWRKPEDEEIAEEIIKIQGPIAPIIRTSEVYYIMCECLADTDLPRAIELLSTVRLARGSKTPLLNMNKDEFLEVLYNEMTREFMSEGQTFFLYKRLNAPIFNGANPLDISDSYVLPLPHGEISYQ